MTVPVPETTPIKLELITRRPAGKTKQTPLLFIHGKWHGAWCWDEHFLPYFVDHGYECIAPSLRGHSRSEGHEKLRWTSIADYVSDVEQVAGQLESPPVIIGHSMGGFITQKYLESHNLPGAVLLAPVPYSGLWPSTWTVFRRHPGLVLRMIVTLSMYPLVESIAIARECLFSADMPDELVEKYQKQMQDESFRAYLDELGLNLVRPQRVKTPLLVLGAANDVVIPTRTVEATAHIYGTRAKFFPNMAHDAMLETGWEQIAEMILNWLDERGL
jgi:pimeloyl-ACP methyl ester carboxylesterase